MGIRPQTKMQTTMELIVSPKVSPMVSLSKERLWSSLRYQVLQKSVLRKLSAYHQHEKRKKKMFEEAKHEQLKSKAKIKHEKLTRKPSNTDLLALCGICGV